MNLRWSCIDALNRACTWVDEVAYRPAVVKLGMPLPRWWRCDLARLSMWLGDRWGSEYWSSDCAPAAPTGLCEACERRAAAFLVSGVSADEAPEADDYVVENAIAVCGGCSLDGPIDDDAGRARALASARERSIAWRWH